MVLLMINIPVTLGTTSFFGFVQQLCSIGYAYNNAQVIGSTDVTKITAAMQFLD